MTLRSDPPGADVLIPAGLRKEGMQKQLCAPDGSPFKADGSSYEFDGTECEPRKSYQLTFSLPGHVDQSVPLVWRGDRFEQPTREIILEPATVGGKVMRAITRFPAIFLMLLGLAAVAARAAIPRLLARLSSPAPEEQRVAALDQEELALGGGGQQADQRQAGQGTAHGRNNPDPGSSAATPLAEEPSGAR